MVVGVKMEHRVASSEIGMASKRSRSFYNPIEMNQLRKLENQRLGVSDNNLTCGGRVGTGA